MAEIYPLGKNRIFYRPRGFKEGLVVTVEMVCPPNQEMNDIELPPLMECFPGLYCFEYEFTVEGTYVAIFSEGGNQVTSQAYSTRRIPVDSGGLKRSFLGNNVINT